VRKEADVTAVLFSYDQNSRPLRKGPLFGERMLHSCALSEVHLAYQVHPLRRLILLCSQVFQVHPLKNILVKLSTLRSNLVDPILFIDTKSQSKIMHHARP
jgi:hypothetical protein